MNNDPVNPSCIRSAADILGAKWTSLIIQALENGPRRFCQIERSVSDINPRILTQRLDLLRDHDIITNNGHDYELTLKGHDLLPILRDMAAWSSKYPRSTDWNIA